MKERDGAVFELLANDALRRKAQSVAIEAQRPLQVIHAQRDHRNQWLHGNSFVGAGKANRGKVSTATYCSDAALLSFPCFSLPAPRTDRIQARLSWSSP